MSDKIKFRVLGGIGNILWQLTARISRYGLYNISLIPGNIKARSVINSWINKDVVNCLPVSEGPIEGYFQDPYWLTDKDVLRRCINLPEDIDTSPVKHFKLVAHLRGKDFLTSQAHQTCIMHPRYIQEVMDICELQQDNVLIITDDIECVRPAIGTGWNVIATRNDKRAFAIMMQAQYLLTMPGSTFSWWAGYLGQQEKVFIPIGTWPCDMGYLKEMSSCQDSGFFVTKTLDERFIALK